jgi:iron complex transport system ATP-binding protein
LLQAVDLEFAYGRSTPVLRGVSLRVQPGSFVGIIGPNGSGKTTLLKALSGTVTPTAGRVLLDDTPLSRTPRSALARRMAVVPQEMHLAFDYTVLEIVLMGRYPHLAALEIEGPRDVEIAREALRATGTETLEHRQFATLSGGEKQRVVIASALAQLHRAPGDRASSVLLLDEPTTALDLGYQLETATLLRDLRARMPITIVISTHDLNFAAGLCDTLVLLREGRIVAAGPTGETLTAGNVRALYGVHADVHHHPTAGHLVVIPLERTGDRP